MRPLYREKGPTSIKSRYKTTTTQAYISVWIKKRLQWKNYEETAMNYEEHAETKKALMQI